MGIFSRRKKEKKEDENKRTCCVGGLDKFGREHPVGKWVKVWADGNDALNVVHGTHMEARFIKADKLIAVKALPQVIRVPLIRMAFFFYKKTPPMPTSADGGLRQASDIKSVMSSPNTANYFPELGPVFNALRTLV